MLYSLTGIEIFSAGTWNGDQYTEQDLDGMIETFQRTSTWFRPALKLGHTENQKLIQEDGLPAAGYISRLYRQGQKLLADLVDIPEKIYNLIKNKAYSRVSSEIYWGAEYDGNKFDKMLAAVALLGNDVPAVQSLNDILALYQVMPDNKFQYKFETKKMYEVMMPNENENKTPETTPEIEVEKVETFSLEEKTKLEEENAKLRGEIEKYSLEKKNAEDELFLADLEKENLLPASAKEYLKVFLGVEKKEYSINKKDYTDKKEVIKDMLKIFSEAAKVNFDQNSLEGKKTTSEEATLEAVEKYSKENNVDYKTAYKAVLKGAQK